MINEKDMVYSWLDGDNININYLHRICKMLTKYFYAEFGDNRKKIRDKIFDWATSNKIYIDFDLNSCINATIDYNYTPLKDEKDAVYVSEYDVDSIIDRFDNKNTRMVAFGLLLYAKQFSTNGEFFLPITAFGDWIQISGSNINSRYIKDLIDYGYIEKINYPSKKWNDLSEERKRFSMPKFRILVNIENVGFYKIQDNNIKRAFNELFKYGDGGAYKRSKEIERISEKNIYEWFLKNYKNILGEDYCIFNVSQKESLIPDFMAVKDGVLYPVECKVGDFNHRALSQLNGYLDYYKCRNGIAVGRKLKASLPENIVFIKHPY